jgi:hypothetical protein
MDQIKPFSDLAPASSSEAPRWHWHRYPTPCCCYERKRCGASSKICLHHDHAKPTLSRYWRPSLRHSYQEIFRWHSLQRNAYAILRRAARVPWPAQASNYFLMSRADPSIRYGTTCLSREWRQGPSSAGASKVRGNSRLRYLVHTPTTVPYL